MQLMIRLLPITLRCRRQESQIRQWKVPVGVTGPETGGSGIILPSLNVIIPLQSYAISIFS